MKQTIDTFEILPGEFKKIKALANKTSGRKDCKVTAYSAQPDSFYTKDFIICTCEICFNYEQRADFSIRLTAFLPDRRRSFVEVIR